MKIQPRLILTSFCTLLASAAIVEAQSPKPRFGYGSVPGGAYVIPAPKTAKASLTTSKPKPKPVAVATAKPKPKAAIPASKPKAVASTKSTTKPTPGKAMAKATPAKSSAAKTTKKEIVSTKSKPAASKAAKPVIAKANPPVRSNGKAPAASVKLAAKPVQTAKIAPRGPKTSPPPRQLSQTAELASTGPGDLTQLASTGGFNFFGSPIILPKLGEATATASSPPDRKTFVDLMAARHSLGGSRVAFQPRLPDPKPVVSQGVAPLTTKVPKVAPTPFVERPPGNAVAAAPEIAPNPPAAQDFRPSTTVADAVTGSTDLLDEPTLARTAPASLSLAPVSSIVETIPEITLLDEPALPSPVLSSVEKPKAAQAKPKPAPEPEPPLPVETPATDLPEAIVDAAGEHDLSERERAFVRSLAEAAGSVTSASGKFNKDLPASITTAATAVLDQIPAETVSTFRSVAKAAKTTAHDLVPDLPMEISNDLMPASPEKMPDQLPSFNAASSGKIDVQSDRQADYDQANNKVIFTGKVELNSAAIRLRAERVEVFMKKGGGGMERVEARGNVLMRTQDTESGPGQMASAGRASYNLKTGEITLSDWPKIQEAGKSHISTDPSTKMYMFTDGRLRTDGPNRTLIGGE